MPITSHAVSGAVEVAGARGGIAVEVTDLCADYGASPVLRGVEISVGGGEVVALLGPSGCGKTTLLRCIAGLEHPRSGSIRIGGVDVLAGNGVRAERRRVGMVFQDGGLFPHRTVLNNVNYGVDRGPSRDQRARDAIRLVALSDKHDRLPGTLSGGEQQRVALARALAPEPGVVLLDEPFSSLDASLRAQLRDEVRGLLIDVGVTAMLVTHDQQEAMSFGDRVAVMNAGRIEQVGTPEEIYASPATPWVAGFVGEAVLLVAARQGIQAHTALGSVTTRASGRGPATVMLRPEQISLLGGGDGRVEVVSYFGAETRYQVRVASIETPVIVRRPGAPQHRVGDAVSVSAAGVVAHAWPA